MDSGNIVCKLDCPQLVKNYNESHMNLKITESELAKQQADILLEAMLLKTRLEAVNSLKHTSEIKRNQMEFNSVHQQKLLDLELKKYTIEIEKLTKRGVLQQKINQYKLEKIKNKILKNKNQVQRATLFMDRLTLVSPANGIVLHEMNPANEAKLNEGDKVWQRLPILKIYDMEHLHVIAEANETSIRRICPDQSVDIYFNAVPGKCFQGHVKDVANVGTVKNQKTRLKKFEIKIEFDEMNERIMPGFSAECHIYSLTIQDTIAIPLECVFYLDSVTVVYIEENKTYREHYINVARRNDNFALIRKGLNGGERLSLEKPPIHLIMSDLK